ncbi:MAG: heme ABC exporter ATP-binding protein CcmA [Herpetosiphon sp.]
METTRLRLEIDKVTKTYGRRQVLRPLAATLEAGEALLVTGRNGSGKSTLLRLLAGLQRPSSGTIQYWIDGALFAPREARQFAGLVGADVQLYRELTAFEHLQFVAQLRGRVLERAEGDDWLAQAGLAGRGHEHVGSFSSGMQQRVRYLLALLHQPAFLLLDEPSTNLDAAGIAWIDELIRAQRKQGIVVVATNDQRDLRYGDQILRLDGRSA